MFALGPAISIVINAGAVRRAKRDCNRASFLPVDHDLVEGGADGGQFLLAIGKTVAGENVRHHIGVALSTEAPRAADRHLAFGEGEQRAEWPVGPAPEEGIAGELRCVVPL